MNDANGADKKLYMLLGLAMRARRLVSGEFAVEKAVKEGSALLVVVADDASENTKKKFTDKCTYYKVPILFFGTRETLGHAVGKEIRASFAITDAGMAAAFREQWTKQGNQAGNGGND